MHLLQQLVDGSEPQILPAAPPHTAENAGALQLHLIPARHTFFF